ncbi:MAG: hypothetical protein AB7Y46_12680 [Armatimonadota bacterium]
MTAVLSLALAGAAHALSVDIVIPETDPAEVYQHARTPFVAVAYDEKANDVSDLASFTWSFPDAKEPFVGNPAYYRFVKTGKFPVSVTATLDKDSGSDEITVNVVELIGTKGVPTEDDFTFFARAGAHVFGGTVCDGVELVVQPIGELPLGWDWCYASFQKWVGGQWVEQHGQVPDYVYGIGWIATCGWSTELEKNEEIDWRVVLALDEVGSEPPNFVDLTIYNTWTPNNTVVKATGPELILHHAEDTSHEIAWNITHYTGGPINPTFTVTVKIYDLQGNLVETLLEEDVPVGQDSTTRDGNLPEQNGIYTYAIEAEHTDDPAPVYPCIDHDKTSLLTISDVHLTMQEFDVRTQVFSYSIGYTLSRTAAGGSVGLRVYDRRFQQVATEVLANGAGAHYLMDSFACDPTITGPYYFVISATESESDGDQNRDGVPKPALQKGAVCCVYPRASHWSDYAGGWLFGTNPQYRLDEIIDDTRYAARVVQALPDKQGVLQSWEDDGIFLLQAHAQPLGGEMQIAPTPLGHIYGRRDGSFDPNYDIALDELPDIYPHLYFAQLQGCGTGNSSPVHGNLCDKLRALGVDITLGFTGCPYTGGPSATWEERLYGYDISFDTLSVWTAATRAQDAVKDAHGDFYGYDTWSIEPWYRRDQSLWPARYGGG